MLYEYEKYYQLAGDLKSKQLAGDLKSKQLAGDLKSKQHFDAFKNFCTSHKAAVKRIKRRKTKCQK